MARPPVDKENRSGDPRFNKNAIVDRRHFINQLFDANGNPTPACYAFAGRMKMEVGGQGPDAQMAFAESVCNRATARSHTIDYEIRNHGRYSYWPQRQSDPGYSNNKQFIDTIRKVVMNGTNLTCGATGNDGVGDGINTKAQTLYVANGERYSIELADRKWHQTAFGKLIRGVGKFLGDIVGALGQAAAAVVKGVVDAGKWVFNGIDRALHPPAQHAPVHPNREHPHQPSRELPHRAPERQPSLVHRIEPVAQPNPRVWKFNMEPEPSAPGTAVGPKTDTRPRPTSNV